MDVTVTELKLVQGTYSIDPSDPKCPRCNGHMEWNWYGRETYVCMDCGWEYEKVKA